MNYLTLDKFGGASLILGSLLLTAYSVLFPLLLPVDKAAQDFVRLVIDPHWMELAWIAFAGVLLMLIGDAARSFETNLGPMWPGSCHRWQ